MDVGAEYNTDSNKNSVSRNACGVYFVYLHIIPMTLVLLCYWHFSGVNGMALGFI